MKNVKESTEVNQKHNNTRKMCQTVNQFKKGYQHKFTIIRNKKRRIFNEYKGESKNMEYFGKLLHTKEPRELIKKGNEISEFEVELTTRSKKGYKKLKK
jgi:hypothetical protein